MFRKLAPIGLALALAACGANSTTTGSTGSREVLRFNTTNLPAAYQYEPFGTDVQVAGGVNPYTLRVTNGTLPPGLRLNGTRLEGTPTTLGRFEFNVEATDASLSTRSQSFAVSVGTLPPLSLTPDFPAGEFRSDTRIPLKINYPRATKAARFYWQLPEGVQVTRLEAGNGGQVLLWKQTGRLLSADLGFVRAPASGSNVALIGLRFVRPTRLDATQTAFTAVGADGKLVAQKTFGSATAVICAPGGAAQGATPAGAPAQSAAGSSPATSATSNSPAQNASGTASRPDTTSQTGARSSPATTNPSGQAGQAAAGSSPTTSPSAGTAPTTGTTAPTSGATPAANSGAAAGTGTSNPATNTPAAQTPTGQAATAPTKQAPADPQPSTAGQAAPAQQNVPAGQNTAPAPASQAPAAQTPTGGTATPQTPPAQAVPNQTNPATPNQTAPSQSAPTAPQGPTVPPAVAESCVPVGTPGTAVPTAPSESTPPAGDGAPGTTTPPAGDTAPPPTTDTPEGAPTDSNDTATPPTPGEGGGQNDEEEPGTPSTPTIGDPTEPGGGQGGGQ